MGRATGCSQHALRVESLETMPVTASEAFVTKLCSRAFLLPWTEPNPIKAPGKELCDVLVVCDPDVIIFSVREIRLQADAEVGAERWRRRAIDASVNQLYGAERSLRGAVGSCAART